MEILLTLPGSIEIQKTEKAEIDKKIEQTISLHENNSVMITKLTMDSVTALTAGEARTKELAQQGFLKKVWNNLTGKNQETRADIDVNNTLVQYASQQMIQKLGEQNLLTFDLITAVNNKLNTMVLELDEEINQIYKALGIFFKKTRSDIIQLEARLDKVERNVELLHWNATIEYQIFDETEYYMLPDIEKVVCTANDFLHRTKGNWSTADLMLLKSTLAEIGLPIKHLISTKSFYNYLIEKPLLIDRLFKDISLNGLSTVEPYEAPLLKGVEKALKLSIEEKYIVETVIEQLNIACVPYTDRDIKLSMIHQYLKNNAYMNPDIEVNLFDFVVELLINLNMIRGTEVVEKNIREIENNKNEGDYDIFLIDFGDSKIKVIKELAEIIGVNLDEAKELVNQVPTTILSKTSKDQADTAKRILIEAGANVVIKTYIENVHFICSNDKAGFIKLRSGSFFPSFTSIGEYITKGSKVAEISDVPIDRINGIHRYSSMKSTLTSEIYSEISGKVIDILVQDGEKVEIGQPIMLILSDE